MNEMKCCERVMVYIDLANIEASLDEKMKSGYTVDYPTLVDCLNENRTLVAAYVFDACVGEDKRSKRMKKITGNSGFRPVMLRHVSGRTEQKGVDMAMGIRMYDEAVKDRFDTAIVVSGDADFIPAMEYVQNAGKRVEVATFSWSANEDLKYASDSYTIIDDLPIICMKGIQSSTKNVSATVSEKARGIA
jgi:uncharacterized LabA/DUF88 family protein